MAPPPSSSHRNERSTRPAPPNDQLAPATPWFNRHPHLSHQTTLHKIKLGVKLISAYGELGLKEHLLLHVINFSSIFTKTPDPIKTSRLENSAVSRRRLYKNSYELPRLITRPLTSPPSTTESPAEGSTVQTVIDTRPQTTPNPGPHEFSNGGRKNSSRRAAGR